MSRVSFSFISLVLSLAQGDMGGMVIWAALLLGFRE
jgi:hypothetical protein